VIDPDGCDGPDYRLFADLMADSPDREKTQGKALDAVAMSMTHADPATLIYTSGTTGPPKGAIITHKNLLCEAQMLAVSTNLVAEGDSTLTWLPMAHIFQRVATLAGHFAGVKTSYAEGIEKLLDNLAEVRPTIFYSVPRIFEKAYSKINEQALLAGFPKKQIFHWASIVGRKVSKLRQINKPIPPLLNLQFQIAHKLVFVKVNEKFGGNIRFIFSSAAPIAREILEFFHACGIISLEAYGATETTAGITINTIENYKFGTVGSVPDGIDLKIAPDGEILVKGDMVFDGYYKDPEMTKEVLSKDGWYATGDVGVLDEDGFLRITDRKKDIIVTSGGKNVAPQNIENLLKRSIYISQVLVHGDKRKYLSALITLDPETLDTWAKERGLPTEDWEALNRHQKVIALIKKQIDRSNGQLAKYETIKYFKIVPQDFTIETEELTPTLKLKRKVITTNYQHLLDSMYTD
jgi:long-chain acyl-CoA synthetase